MKLKTSFLLMTMLLTLGVTHAEKSLNPTLRIFPGYVTKVSCEGKLLVSSIGNDGMIRLEPLPATLGCAVLLKPLAASGRTNLILETSSSSVQVTVEVRTGIPTNQDLQVSLKGDHK